MKIIAFFFLASFTILPEFYFVVPALTFGNFSLLFIIYLTFLLKDELKDQNYLISSEQKYAQTSLLAIGFIFTFYIFIINLYRGEVVPAINNVLLNSGIILCLPLFNYFFYKKKYNLIAWLYFIIIIHFVFVLFQISGIDIILTDLMPQNMLIGTLGKPEYFSKFFRATGAISSPITLASQMLALLVVAIASFNKSKNLKDIFFILFSIVILIATQARAVLFSFIPLMIMCNFIFIGGNFRKFIYASILIVGIIFIILGFLENLQYYFPYTFQIVDRGDTHRLWTNIYISIGVLNESPLFGVPVEKVWEIYDKYAAPDYNPFYDFEKSAPTHHNQLLFFLRYYGLIGIVLFLALYFKIFKAIILAKDKHLSFLVGTIFVLDLFFSMTHNNKIFNPLLWIYLSLIFVPLKKEE